MSRKPRRAQRAKPKRKSEWGGARPNSGPKKNGEKKPTILSVVELRAAESADVPDEIDSIAQRYVLASVKRLGLQLAFGTSEAAMIAAAKEILDRGWGKPSVELGSETMLPFMRKPAPPTITDEVRLEARKYGTIAIAVLNKIASDGKTETARVAADKAMLDRGLGTVAPARMPDEFGKRPLGKKEEAQRAAESAATGRYATPKPPKIHNETIQ